MRRDAGPGGTPSGVAVRALRLDDAADADALVELLDHYARDPMGGGEGLTAEVRANLVPRLRAMSGYVGGLAFVDGRPAGLINCFLGFSTFAARPLLNVHDLIVREGHRGAGVGQALLAFAEAEARRLGCCKLTLEVLTGNASAMKSYERAGFRPYALDPRSGTATFLQKKIAGA
jgi:GNAT superfamily N-acetyltransferase